MEKYKLVTDFKGYLHKQDRTNMPPGVLTVGSQNVLINDGERCAVRQGYTLDGQANDAMTPIETSFDWERHTGDVRHLRSYGDELEYRYVDADGVVTWRRLANEWDSVGEWVYNNKDYFTALSFLPEDTGSYVQAPFESITKEKFEEWQISNIEAMNLFSEIAANSVTAYELESAVDAFAALGIEGDDLNNVIQDLADTFTEAAQQMYENISNADS